MKKFSLFALAILSLGFVTFSCELLEDAAPIALSPNFIKNVAIVSLTDDASRAASGIVNDALNGTVVTLEGPDAAKVFDLQGNRNFVVAGGSITLMLDPNANFASQSSYNVNIVIEPNGYLKAIIPVRFTKNTPLNTFTAFITNKAKLPSGTSLQTATAAIPATGIAAPLVVTAAGADANDVKTTVTVPVGTIMKDANNNTLSGTVSAQVVSFNASENSAFFPGGLDSRNIKVGTEIKAGTFAPAAFASVTMTVGNAVVKNFTGAKVAVRLAIDKDAINTKTSKAYVDQDAIDVFSYNTTTGQWEFQVTTKVQKDVDNSLFVLYETSHLSYFSVGQLVDKVFCPGKKDGDTVLHTVTWTGTASTFEVDIFFSSDNIDGTVSSFNRSTRTFKKGDQLELEAATSSGATDVSFFNKETFKFYGSIVDNQFCSPQTINFGTIDSAANAVTLNFTATCPNLARGALIEPPLGTQVHYKIAGSTGGYKVLHTVNSQISARAGNIVTDLLTVGTSYDFKVVAGSTERFRNNIRINSANETYSLALGSDLCDFLKK